MATATRTEPSSRTQQELDDLDETITRIKRTLDDLLKRRKELTEGKEAGYA